MKLAFIFLVSYYFLFLTGQKIDIEASVDRGVKKTWGCRGRRQYRKTKTQDKSNKSSSRLNVKNVINICLEKSCIFVHNTLKYPHNF